MRQTVRHTPYFIEYYLPDENPKGYNFYTHYYDTFDEMMYDACKILAFSDLEGAYDVHIYENEKPIKYQGWMPGMRFVFKDYRDEVVWDQSYPEWDH